MKTSAYDIQTNPNGRKILIIKDFINDEEEARLKEDDFDAMFITFNGTTIEIDSLIVHVNPLVSKNSIYDYKPMFISSRLKNHELFFIALADGDCVSIDDKNMCARIEEIIGNRERWHIKSKTQFFNYNRPELLFMRIYRFCISRGIDTPSHTTRNGSTLGYVRQYFNETHHLRLFHYSDSLSFHKRMVQKGYLKLSNLVDRIQVCPVCMHTHLMFIENCPYCENSDLSEENIIHHFRCANVSKEEDYVVEDKLICPKCHRELRHIGVDYDRPSSIYICNSCKKSFMDAGMKVLCTNCGNAFNTEELRPFDFYDYTITPEGYEFFTSEDYLKNLSDIMMLNVVDTAHTFMVRLTQMANVIKPQGVENDVALTVVKFVIKSDKRKQSDSDSQSDNDVMKGLYNHFNDCYVSSDKNMMWAMHTVEQTKDLQVNRTRAIDVENMMKDFANNAVENYSSVLRQGEYFDYKIFSFKNGDEIQTFIDKLSEAE